MKLKYVYMIMLLVILMFTIGCSNKTAKCMIENVAEIESDKYACSYEGVKHSFILDLPENIENAPLILMLHGYGESGESFKSKSAFDKDANELGYVVAYVTGAPNPNDLTSATGWNSGIGISDNNDVEFLKNLSKYLCETYKLDTNRVFAVGFSNGAFMTHRLALEANDTFKAVVSVAGMMPESVWESKPEALDISIFQITGQKDDVIPKNSDGSAKYSKAPAIEDVIEYYANANGLFLSDIQIVGKKSELAKYKADGKTNQAWNLFIPDGRHSWPDEDITGININRLILEFLSTQ